MKKGTIALLVVGVFILALVMGTLTTYNGLVSKDEAVATAWGNVQSQYQRRADLVPNLVSTVKGYAKHESETLEGVVAARAKATQITVNADELTPEKLKQYQAAQGELSQALGRLMAIQENYPQLKAQLEGTENRINESRQLFNSAVQTYNVSVRRFPANIVAGMFGFEKKSQFEAESGAEKAPKVEF